MIISSGWGFLALLIPFVMAVIVDFVLGSLLGGSREIYLNIGVILGGVILWFLGRWLNRRPVKILIDPETGERVGLSENHSLFWIPMQYWGFLWLLFLLVIEISRFMEK